MKNVDIVKILGAHRLRRPRAVEQFRVPSAHANTDHVPFGEARLVNLDLTAGALFHQASQLLLAELLQPSPLILLVRGNYEEQHVPVVGPVVEVPVPGSA